MISNSVFYKIRFLWKCSLFHTLHLSVFLSPSWVWLNGQGLGYVTVSTETLRRYWMELLYAGLFSSNKLSVFFSSAGHCITLNSLDSKVLMVDFYKTKVGKMVMFCFLGVGVLTACFGSLHSSSFSRRIKESPTTYTGQGRYLVSKQDVRTVFFSHRIHLKGIKCFYCMPAKSLVWTLFIWSLLQL